MAEITPALLDGLPKNGPTDPIEYYRRPVVGMIYRERINRGLRLLPPGRFDHTLEVGYGAGAVLMALGEVSENLAGIDLDADPVPVIAALERKGRKADLRKGSVYELPFESGSFDLAACFSVFEHLDRYETGLREVARVLRPGGHFLLGMPAVNKVMEYGFLAIGFKGIEDHHITTPQTVAKSFERAGFRVARHHHLDLPVRRPLGLRVYYNWLLKKEGLAR